MEQKPIVIKKGKKKVNGVAKLDGSKIFFVPEVGDEFIAYHADGISVEGSTLVPKAKKCFDELYTRFPDFKPAEDKKE